MKKNNPTESGIWGEGDASLAKLRNQISQLQASQAVRDQRIVSLVDLLASAKDITRQEESLRATMLQSIQAHLDLIARMQELLRASEAVVRESAVQREKMSVLWIRWGEDALAGIVSK